MPDQLKWVLLGLAALVPATLFASYPLRSLFEQNQTELPLSVIDESPGPARLLRFLRVVAGGVRARS